jgi:hypothetical protein
MIHCYRFPHPETFIHYKRITAEIEDSDGSNPQFPGSSLYFCSEGVKKQDENPYERGKKKGEYFG